MKVLIEIDEKTFKDLYKLVTINIGLRNGKTIIWKCLRAISKGVPIPNNATNEDVVNLMFPNGLGISDFHWWNAPYKGGE